MPALSETRIRATEASPAIENPRKPFSPEGWGRGDFNLRASRHRGGAEAPPYSVAARTGFLDMFSEANSQFRILPSTLSRYFGRAFW